MAIRVVIVVDETPFFYGIHAHVSEYVDDGSRVPVMSRDFTTAKTAADGLEGAYEAIQRLLFA